MRKSRILVLLSATLLFLAGIQSVQAQKGELRTFIGGNVLLGFPSGDFADGYRYAAGIDGSLGVGMARNLYLIGTMGYVSYKNEDSNPYGKIRLIPLKAGIRIYPGKGFFLAGNAGVGFLKDEVMSSGESRFIYDVGMGVHAGLLQAGFYYDGWQRKNNNGTSNTFQVKVGFALK